VAEWKFVDRQNTELIKKWHFTDFRSIELDKSSPLGCKTLPPRGELLL
jgi:hypothetical protein